MSAPSELWLHWIGEQGEDAPFQWQLSERRIDGNSVRYVRADVVAAQLAEKEKTVGYLGMSAQVKDLEEHIEELEAALTEQEDASDALSLCIATLNAWVKIADPSGLRYTKKDFLPGVPDVKS